MNIDSILKNRFDIKIKILYLRDREKWSYLYFYHLLLWGGGKIYEADGSKSSYDDFLKAFDKTYNSIKENGFKGAIKAFKYKGDIYPIEGAHRLACCIHLGIEPKFNIITQRTTIYNESFFKSLGMIQQEVDKVNSEFNDK